MKKNADADDLSRITQTEEKTPDEQVISAMALAAQSQPSETHLAFSVVSPGSLETVDPIQPQEVPSDILGSQSLSSKDHRRAQHDDPVISQFIGHIVKGTRPSAKHVVGSISLAVKYLRDWDNLELSNGVLYRYSQYKGHPYKQLVMPESVREILTGYTMTSDIRAVSEPHLY